MNPLCSCSLSETDSYVHRQGKAKSEGLRGMWPWGSKVGSKGSTFKVDPAPLNPFYNCVCSSFSNTPGVKETFVHFNNPIYIHVLFVCLREGSTKFNLIL